ncbi:hypothetical protein niasHS_010701 [Heterodera schachtii]|uniref:Uncharacterized protein n=1 Tax=Heterodera schachtii TaxID=97005 RepID=A0ABD2ISC4_HETSC
MISNFALEKSLRYFKLVLLVVIALSLVQINKYVFTFLANLRSAQIQIASPLYDISEKGYNPKMPTHPVLFKLLIDRNYFAKSLSKEGKFKYSAVTCFMNNSIIGLFSTHTMCQLPYYAPSKRNSQNVFFFGGEEDRIFRDNFQLLTGAYYNLTVVNNTHLDELVEQHLGLKDLVSEGHKFGTTELIKYDIEKPGQEQLALSLTTPVEACVIFVALRRHSLDRVRKFVWEMNFALYHVMRMQLRIQPYRFTFVSFIRHSCLAKYNAQGPFLVEMRPNGLQIRA